MNCGIRHALEAGLGSRSERSSSSNLAWAGILDPTSYVD